MQLVEFRLGIDLASYLEEHYVNRGRLLKNIAVDLGVDIGTVSRWKDHFRLERPAEKAS